MTDLPQIRIRRFIEGDRDLVVALWHEAGLVRPWNVPEEDIALKVAFQPELFFVAERGAGTDRDAQIVGSVMAGYDGHRGWIYYLAVADDTRRTGLGRALMDHAEGALRALGCPKINLQVRSSNLQVLAFYEALGFQRDDSVSLGKRLDGRKSG